MRETVLLERDAAVAILTLNQARKRNAVSMDLIDGLRAALDQVDADPSFRAILLRGEGGHFCVGGDLSVLNTPPMQTRRDMSAGHAVIRRLIGGSLPVVAAVEGNAFGAGFSIAMACDFVVADSRSTFCAAFGRVGLMPDYALLWTLPQRVGLGVAREIVMLCEMIGGGPAKQLGIVDVLADDGQVPEIALQRAHRLAKAPPGSLSAIKAVLSRVPMSMDSMLAWEADTQTVLIGSDDFKEGVRAFFDKRPATFKGA